MNERTILRARALGWALVAVGLVAILITMDRPEPEGWAVFGGLAAVVVGAVLVGLRYILR